MESSEIDMSDCSICPRMRAANVGGIVQVNKPYLPLASGEFTMQSALAIVGICGIAALVIGVLVGSLPLMTTLVGSAVLSLAYSVDLPFLRWKQNPVAAAACILAVRYVPCL